jgi:type VI protein secretion system component Hcp
MKLRIAGGWKWAVALGAVFVPALVMGAIDLPYTFKAGTPIKAAEMNANFDALKARLDALAPAASPDVGTMSINGFAATPIHKFSWSTQTAYVIGQGAAAKPQLSNITIVRDAGAGSVDLNLDIAKDTALGVSFVIGDLKIDLGSATVAEIAVQAPVAGKPQEAVSFALNNIKWTWQPANQAAKSLSFSVGTGTGGSAGVSNYAYGYFPAGLAPDNAHVPIASYTHDITCTGAIGPGGKCKGTFQPLTVQKAVEAGTLDELGPALSGKNGHIVNLDWFNADSSINNSVLLGNASIIGINLTTGPDGKLLETVTFGYAQITWTEGQTTGGWDATTGTPL